jgi:hypothetical protein
MIAGGSLQWLPARVMSDLPRWHTQRCGRCQNSRYLHGQARALPLSSTTCLARTSPRAQSCAIALRSPAPERSSDLKRYSPSTSAHPVPVVNYLMARAFSLCLVRAGRGGVSPPRAKGEDRWQRGHAPPYGASRRKEREPPHREPPQGPCLPGADRSSARCEQKYSHRPPPLQYRRSLSYHR